MVKNKPDMKDINSKIFDSASDSYEKEVQDSINFSGIQHDVLVNAKINLLKIKSKSLNLRPNSHILDIGCGKGLMHSQLTSIGFKVTGIDVSEKSLAQAKLLNPECSYSQFDGSNIPFEANTFDFAMSVCVYHHIQAKIKRKVLSAEALRVLRRGAKFAIIEHNPLNLLTRIAVSRCEFDRDASLMRRSSAKRLLKDSGFQNIRGDYFMFIPRAGLLTRKLESYFSALPIGTQYLVYGEKLN